jgi:hypothetical protein
MIALASYARRSSARLSSTFVSANAARFARVSFSPDINIKPFKSLSLVPSIVQNSSS